ncbi:MAG: UPF0175 family protein [Planctomycetaceae bacterium]|jgi:hypothetical protein|nr:UPF0175 family protein [Planctomycetaceae bacterium]
MTTLTLQLELPDNCKLSEQEAKASLVLKLYEDGKLSAGKGAEILGITKREFIETFGTVCWTTSEDLRREYELVCQFSRHLDKPSILKSV